MKETVNNSFTITVALRRAAGDTNFAHVYEAFSVLKDSLEASYSGDVDVTMSLPLIGTESPVSAENPGACADV